MGDATPRSANAALTALGIWEARTRESARDVAFMHREPNGWRATTWGEAGQTAREIAAGLADLGVEPGDRVCLVAQTRLEWVLCDAGILLAGAIAVPIYPSSTPGQCEFIIGDAGAKVVIVEDAAQRNKLGAVSVPIVIMAGASPSLEDLRRRGRDWLAAHPTELQRRANAIGSDSLFTIIYTSGTTGRPKGVMLSHGNLIAAVDSAIRAFTIRDGDTQFLFLPLAHVLGRELEWVAVRIGAPTWFSEGLAKIKDNLLEVRPTFFASVPRVYEKVFAAVHAAIASDRPRKRKLIRWAIRVGGDARAGVLARAVAERLVLRKLRAKLGLDRCRFLISGGAPLSAEIAQFFHACGVLILEGYGLTETMAAAFVNRPERFRFGTVGPAIDVIEVKIAGDGEILMRGPSVFGGYYNDRAATAEAIDAEGWLHSGDVGRLEDGFLRITDRKKDLIVTAGGKNVAPQAIENALKAESALISQALVYGDRRPYCVALLTLSEAARPRHGTPALAAELQKSVDSVNARLASFEAIKRFAVLPEDFTEANEQMTPSLKVKRKAVVEKYRDTIEGLYAIE
jgi:long-chain acyl-CoA synthetase